MQEWHPGQGVYQLTGYSRIVRERGPADALKTASRLFAEELGALTGGHTLAEAVGTPADLAAGDIFLTLAAADQALGNEGYALHIGEHIVLVAPTETGIFYGTRTLLQLLRHAERQGMRSLPWGVVRDWPVKPERSVMIDNGRKYFTPAWLADQVREMAYLKLNTLHLHVVDDEGFRIESVTHPEVVSTAHLTKQDVRELVALAARYHVTVFPEIDMPCHMAAVLAAHPELQLYDVEHKAADSDIDLANPKSYTLMRELLAEYLPLFPGPYWHIGGDECEYFGAYERFPQLQTYAREHYGGARKWPRYFSGFHQLGCDDHPRRRQDGAGLERRHRWRRDGHRAFRRDHRILEREQL